MVQYFDILSQYYTFLMVLTVPTFIVPKNTVLYEKLLTLVTCCHFPENSMEIWLRKRRRSCI